MKQCKARAQLRKRTRWWMAQSTRFQAWWQKRRWRSLRFLKCCMNVIHLFSLTQANKCKAWRTFSTCSGRNSFILCTHQSKRWAHFTPTFSASWHRGCRRFFTLSDNCGRKLFFKLTHSIQTCSHWNWTCFRVSKCLSKDLSNSLNRVSKRPICRSNLQSSPYPNSYLPTKSQSNSSKHMSSHYSRRRPSFAKIASSDYRPQSSTPHLRMKSNQLQFKACNLCSIIFQNKCTKLRCTRRVRMRSTSTFVCSKLLPVSTNFLTVRRKLTRISWHKSYTAFVSKFLTTWQRNLLKTYPDSFYLRFNSCLLSSLALSSAHRLLSTSYRPRFLTLKCSLRHLQI